eukprot:3617937-Amphidinium_carterae.1
MSTAPHSSQSLNSRHKCHARVRGNDVATTGTLRGALLQQQHAKKQRKHVVWSKCDSAQVLDAFRTQWRSCAQCPL